MRENYPKIKSQNAKLREVLENIIESGFINDKNGDESGGHLLSQAKQAIAKATGRE